MIEGRKLTADEIAYRKYRQSRPDKKYPLSKKQQKAREKSKRASTTRNKRRKHFTYPQQLKQERISRLIIK